GARKRARRVREAVWGNGPVDKTGTAPRIDFTVHKDRRLREFVDTHEWITCYFLPAYAPDLNPVEGIWSLLRRSSQANTAFSDPEHLISTLRHGLRKIQYRSNLIDGYLAETGLTSTTPRQQRQ
ncbi:transposase, partial [Streptomyces sp. NPDC001027]|uniref:transposase n=1 Tax=Streptomyces sp. NPDC001027 TaxID=3154771 RepID=UPI00332B8A98